MNKLILLISTWFILMSFQTFGENIFPIESCRTGSASADTNIHSDTKLSIRGTSIGFKSWIKFDISTIDIISLESATLWLTLNTERPGTYDFDIAYVNDDCLDNINWTENTLTWNNAPGNDINSVSALDSTKTTYIETVTVSNGAPGDMYRVDIIEAVLSDTDGIIQIILYNSNAHMDMATHDHLNTGWQPFLDTSSISTPLAFPGAEGFGAETIGGRGGIVYEVTNLNDSGPGSLREAVEASGPRTVVFRVGGTIALTSKLAIRNDFITIAGQTAPGDGICLKDHEIFIAANQVIIRYIRSRVGSAAGMEYDAIWARDHSNIIIDHCSFSWSVDETASFYDNENFTLQWCIISESLYDSVHPKGFHGFGGIWGGNSATFHHNLLAHHSSRNPRFAKRNTNLVPDIQDYLVDYRNNVIYNWGYNSAYGGEDARVNIVANYYKPGPATRSSVNDRIFQPLWGLDFGVFHINNNFMEGSSFVTNDNWLGVDDITQQQKDQMKSATAFDAPEISQHTATQAYNLVLQDAGANIPVRDSLDERIMYEVQTGTAQYGSSFDGGGNGIIDSPSEVGGWPNLNGGVPDVDSDHDGMPDYWEKERCLDPLDYEDGNLDRNSNGYTNLEEYLYWLTGYPSPTKNKADLDCSSIVDMLDFAIIATHWQEYASIQVSLLNPNFELPDISDGTTISTDVPGWGNDITITDPSLVQIEQWYPEYPLSEDDQFLTFGNSVFQLIGTINQEGICSVYIDTGVRESAGYAFLNVTLRADTHTLLSFSVDTNGTTGGGTMLQSGQWVLQNETCGIPLADIGKQLIIELDGFNVDINNVELWLPSVAAYYDLDGNGLVDINDLMVLSDSWLL